MVNGCYVLTYDVGTTSMKTCLYEIADRIAFIASSMAEYPLSISDIGGVEQDPDDWWAAMRSTTHDLLQKSNVSASEIQGISFCSQMQGLVLVDANGHALRPVMSYMDHRANEEYQEGIMHGLKIAGLNASKLLTSLYLTGGVSASVKDPLWKYKWVEKHEPELFSRVYKWLDVKDYLLLRCTDRFVMTEDSAHVTFFYTTRQKRFGWSQRLCRMFGVNRNHFPIVIKSTDVVGPLTETAAAELGLIAGTPVYGGGGDVSMLGLGAGCVNEGDTHIYIGTSGWVSSVVKKRMVDITHFIASIIGARPGFYNYISEQETSGKCLEWVKDHLALDEIGVYLEKKQVDEDVESKYNSLLDYLSEIINETEPGSGGVIFTPWLQGNRSPFEDPNARAMFFNISLTTGKRKLIRSVVEGICMHKRWMLDCIEKKALLKTPIRFVGGGALSDVTSQILSDVIGKPVESVENPQNAGALGAAILCGIGLGKINSFEEARELIPTRKIFHPNSSLTAVYNKNYSVFKNLYKQNKKAFHQLNSF
jgi:xylulokinase